MESAFGVDHGEISKGFKLFGKKPPKPGINPGFGTRKIAPGGPVQRGSSGGSNAMEDQRKAALAAVRGRK